MARRKIRTVLYRRKREQKTNYNKRLKLLLSGKSRIVLRFTNQRVIAQLVNFTGGGDKVVVATDSFALKKLGWSNSCKNFPAAYLTGLLFGKKAVEKGQKEAILDTGSRAPLKKGKQYAFLKGVLEAGVDIPHSEEVLPDDEKVQGKSIAEYLKSKSKPEQISSQFTEVKKKIQG